MEMTLEVIVVPVADVDRAKDFYAGKLGFNVDTDAQLTEDFRVVQLTPTGSGCSIILMTQGAQMDPGTLKGAQLVVADLRSTREELAARGVAVSEVQVVEGGPPRPAAPDDQLDYRGFVFFEDPATVRSRDQRRRIPDVRQELGTVRGSPKCGKRPVSVNQVIAATASPSSVSTNSPVARAIAACASGR